VHISSKDKAEWWLQKFKKRYNTDHIIMSELKRLAILEKIVKDNINEIEEIDIYKIQKKDTAEVKDLKNLI